MLKLPIKIYRFILIGCAVLISVAIISILGFPKLMKIMIKKEINLKLNSETRQMWQNFPIPIMFSIYVFNVTNPQEVLTGDKPKLKEIGPFVFEEWKDKYDIEDIDNEDAVEFNMRNTFIFRPDLGLSGKEFITMPHPLIQFIAIAIKREKPAMINMIAQGLQDLFQPKSAFIQVTFMELFFKGFMVDCSNEDSFAAGAICLNFHTGAIKGAEKLNETHFLFSLLGASNHSDAGRFKVSRGIRNNRMIGQVLEFEGEEELNVWPGEECNRLRGTDSTIFAPLMKPHEGLWAFSADLCRSLGPQFQKKVKYNGIQALRYTMDFGDVKNEPENQCFCKDYPDDCPAKGTMDLSLCNETPMIASMPHFLNGDPKLLENIEGLQPSEEKHGIFIDFEIISGTPLSVAKRLQFNLDVEPVEELPVMSKLKPLVMPLFWIEEAVDLDKSFTDIIKSKVFTTKKVVMIIMWNFVVIGLCGAVFAGVMLYLRKNDLIQVTDIRSNVGNNAN
ncbi:sensory neuron membrane protein 1-like isoform 1-T1 [Cochliomyia hominivorax]